MTSNQGNYSPNNPSNINSKEKLKSSNNNNNNTNINNIPGIPENSPDVQELSFIYKDNCKICLLVFFIIIFIIGLALLICSFIISIFILIPAIILIVLSIILINYFYFYTQFLIDKINNLLIINNLKICSFCSKKCCIDRVSFDINLVFQAEVQQLSSSKGAVYKTVIRLVDGSLANIEKSTSNDKASFEKKRDIINIMLFNFRGSIPVPVAVQNAYMNNEMNRIGVNAVGVPVPIMQRPIYPGQFGIYYN